VEIGDRERACSFFEKSLDGIFGRSRTRGDPIAEILVENAVVFDLPPDIAMDEIFSIATTKRRAERSRSCPKSRW